MKTKHMQKLLMCNGFTLNRYNGDHAIYISDKGATVSIPVGHKEINRMLSRRLIKENNLQVI